MFYVTYYCQTKPPSLEDFYSTPCTSTQPLDITVLQLAILKILMVTIFEFLL